MVRAPKTAGLDHEAWIKICSPSRRAIHELVPFKVRTLDDSSPSRKWTDELMNPSEPDCLKKNTFKEEKCQDVIYALYDCCQAFYDRNGDDAKSASCPKPDLLRLKLRMRKEDKAGDNSQ